MAKDDKAKDIVASDESVKTETEIVTDNKETKKQKRKGEFKAFLILLLIIGIAAGACWYWYKYIYDANKGSKNNEVKEETKTDTNYEVVSYESNGQLSVFGEYVVETKDNKIVKVLDLATNVLFEGKLEYYDIYLDKNGNLYAYINDASDYGNNLVVYKFENGKFNEEINLNKTSVYYSPLIYDVNNVLLGFVGYSATNDAIDEDYEIKNTLYLLGNEEIELGDFYLTGDGVTLSLGDDLFTDSDRYVIAAKGSGTSSVYGVYDLKDHKLAIDLNYERLYRSNGDTYVAIKDGRSGIIDLNLKKLVDFNYDFIDVNDDYYVVGKDNKMAIMKSDYTLLTDFVFDYQDAGFDIEYSYLLCCASFNTFASYKINDKIVLVTNDNEEFYGRLDYKNHTAYVIGADGKYTTIEQNMFSYNYDTGLIYSYSRDSHSYSIYDNDLKEMYKIDVTNYDFDDVPLLTLVNKTTIKLNGTHSSLYDYATGKELKEEAEFNYEFGVVKLNYKPSDNILNIVVNEKKYEFNVTEFNFYDNFAKIGDQNFYIVSYDKNYIYISLKKSE